MVQGIAAQILNETPSQTQASVTPPESSAPANESMSQEKPAELNDFDSRFGVLAKMERKLKEQEARNREKEKEWEAKNKRLLEMDDEDKLWNENPLEALRKKKGWGVQEFNQFAVENSTDEDMDPVAQMTKGYEDRIKAMEAKFAQTIDEKIKAKEDEIAGREQDGQIREFKSGIKNFLSENKETYEFIHAEETGAESVYELIYADIVRQREAGATDDQLKVMDVKEAAEKVETYLDKVYSKYLSLNKVKSKFSNGNETDLSRFITKSEPTTLNSSFSPKSKSINQLSAEERKQSAADLVRSWKQQT